MYYNNNTSDKGEALIDHRGRTAAEAEAEKLRRQLAELCLDQRLEEENLKVFRGCRQCSVFQLLFHVGPQVQSFSQA